jgi:hypothetical protein
MADRKINDSTDKKCNRCGKDTEVIIGQFRKCPTCETTEEKFEPYEPLRDFFDFDKDDDEAEKTIDFDPTGFKIISSPMDEAWLDAFKYMSTRSSYVPTGAKDLIDSDDNLGNNADPILNIDPDGQDGND